MHMILPAMNILAFLLFGLDKHRARNRRRRIPESALLTSAFFFGAPGAWLGMYLFRHKTKKTVFRILIPLLALIQTILLFSGMLRPVFSHFGL